MGRIEVPTFDNTVAGFKEFKKRCNLYRARMKIEQREKQVALAILGQLTGLAWQACEELADKPEELDQDGAFEKLMRLLEARFAQEKLVELPDAFEDYFYKGNRRHKETLFDYIQRARAATKKIKYFKLNYHLKFKAGCYFVVQA